MTMTVQELITRLDGLEDGATVQVKHYGANFHVHDIKEEDGNAILIINPGEEEEED